MECTFVPGQKVVCIDDNFPDTAFDIDDVLPREGETYTVRDVFTVRNGSRAAVVIRVEEITNPERAYEAGVMECGFIHSRFLPLITRKTDISSLTKLLNTKRIGVPA